MFDCLHQKLWRILGAPILVSPGVLGRLVEPFLTLFSNSWKSENYRKVNLLLNEKLFASGFTLGTPNFLESLFCSIFVLIWAFKWL